MARYTGPKCRLCRREKTKLFLKGARCYSDKCALTKRNFQTPGQHGKSRSRKTSNFERHLREKQKVKRIYGVLETQFVNYFKKALAQREGITGENLLKLLERRLDNVLYISGIAASRAMARQMIRQGYFTVNDKPVNIPSFQVSKDDTISIGKDSSVLNTSGKEDMPNWLSYESKTKQLKVLNLPTRDDIADEIEEQLIVEYYSR